MKVNVSKKQIIACVLIVLLAAVVGIVGKIADEGIGAVPDREMTA